jgi:hypothetical protein
MFDKKHILEEIKRTTEANGGVPLGWRKFQTETGIRDHDWQKHWARWGEAQVEAGFTPNVLTPAIGEKALLRLLLDWSVSLGGFRR